MSGFQLGVSYTPDATVRDPFSNGFGVSPTAGNGIQEVFEIAANYAGEIGSVPLGIDVYYVTGGGPTNAPDPKERGVAIIDSEWTSSSSSNSSWRTEIIQVGGGYSPGAGVDLGLDIQFIENDYGTSVTGTAEVTAAGLVLAISF